MAEKKMIIDGVSCPFTTERNVLEVARNNGIDIPSLCYCENLSIYGGCRLCLVENDRGKMDAACSMQPRDGMVVNTHTKQVLDSRRTTLQLLMSSHRADCLTCDQSGRCKLQEYARRYHVDAHRFEPNTYCTEPMDLSSPSIVRDPSKCILCGLCVRTCAEIQNIGAVDFSGRTWEQWLAEGKDHHSIYADPMFVDPGRFDFRLKPGSPALKLGFRQIDLSQVGPRPCCDGKVQPKQ